MLLGRGVPAFLVGEAFMRAPDPGAVLREFIKQLIIKCFMPVASMQHESPFAQ